MYYLSHSAKEIDEKIKRIPLSTISESAWVRTKDWESIADQVYDPKSGFAQSGFAVAAAIALTEQKLDNKLAQLPTGSIEAITDDEIIELFSDD